MRGSCLLGCRVSELCRLRWKEIEPQDGAGQVCLLGKGNKLRTVLISTTTLELFESLGRGNPEEWLFRSDRRNGPLTRQAVAARMAKWGREAGVRLYPHRCRHTHATMPSGEELMSSHFKQPSDTVHLARQVITLLLSLATVLLCGWANGKLHF